ncbi:MAG TPA: choice-of-anchor tandem repeat GloVer-containing protein [Terriglobia bacterium]|nr:choice-of-anchor tandem repeat GloVer-containing protein [Terriglobia bacterium]
MAAAPWQALIEGTDGNFYGTTLGGGTSISDGMAFTITSTGTLTTLHDFTGADGVGPIAPLFQGTNGNFYGTTSLGGAFNSGTVFGLSIELGRFVKTLPTTGKVGTLVVILGTNLKGATSVTFNGTAATFTVESATAIKTTVPTGATTGPVLVVTPSGTLTSNVNFQVEP